MNLRDSDLDLLWALCEEFIEENKIHCEEAIGQMDHVIENAYDFIASICNLVGYKRD
jgi:hypothetical protein